MDSYCIDCNQWFNPAKGHHCPTRKSLAEELLSGSKESPAKKEKPAKDSEPVKNNETVKDSENESQSDFVAAERERKRRWRENNRQRYNEYMRNYRKKRRKGK